MNVVATGLSRSKARALEEVLITVYTVKYLDNARHEISRLNIPKFQYYINAITELRDVSDHLYEDLFE